MTRHLSREQLLRHLDGELSRPARGSATRHLQACWSCQVEFDRLKQHIGAIFDAQSGAFVEFPPPPNPWPRIEPRLEASAAKGGSLWTKLAPLAAWRSRVPLAYGAAALALLLTGFLFWAPLAPVSAHEVLQRIAAADEGRLSIAQHQVVRQRVRVKKTVQGAAGERTARIESWKSVRSAYWNMGADPVSTELQDRYQSNGLKLDLPLSPSALESWVKLAGSEPSAFHEGRNIAVQVGSNTQGRERGLERVNFHVRVRDWHVDQMTLSFVGATFQISEEDSSILEKHEVSSDVLAKLELERAPVSSHSGTVSAPAIGNLSRGFPRDPLEAVNFDDLEISVRFDLHGIGADLGEGIEIARRPGQLVVNAINVSPQRKQQLAVLLAGKPAVHIEFEPDGGDAGPGKAANRKVLAPPVTPRQRPDDDRLAQFFGNAAAEEAYARTLLQASSTVLAHLYALRELAVRWPPDEAGRLSADACAKLTAMVRDHAKEYQTAASAMKKQWDLLLGGLGRPLSGRTAAGSTARWQDAGTMGLDAALKVDSILRALLTTSDATITLDEALPKLQQGFSDMELAARQLSE